MFSCCNPSLTPPGRVTGAADTGTSWERCVVANFLSSFSWGWGFQIVLVACSKIEKMLKLFRDIPTWEACTWVAFMEFLPVKTTYDEFTTEWEKSLTWKRQQQSYTLLSLLDSENSSWILEVRNVQTQGMVCTVCTTFVSIIAEQHQASDVPYRCTRSIPQTNYDSMHWKTHTTYYIHHTESSHVLYNIYIYIIYINLYVYTHTESYHVFSPMYFVLSPKRYALPVPNRGDQPFRAAQRLCSSADPRQMSKTQQLIGSLSMFIRVLSHCFRVIFVGYGS